MISVLYDGYLVDEWMFNKSYNFCLIKYLFEWKQSVLLLFYNEWYVFVGIDFGGMSLYERFDVFECCFENTL